MKKEGRHIHDLIKLYDQYIREASTGKRLQKNGKRIRKSSITNYNFLRLLLTDFSVKKSFPLRIKSLNKLKMRELNAEKKYWQLFYKKFTDYMYHDCDCYDNYVGSNIKLLRGFFNYLNNERSLNIGAFHKRFYAPHEETEIIILLPEQLNYLIGNSEFEKVLPAFLQRTKDMFVFGCTVALRISDIFKVSWRHIEIVNDRYYLKVKSQKTNTFTRVLLPEYAVNILKKYPPGRLTIFPSISKARFNINVKLLIEKAGWNHECLKTRQKQGIPTPVYKNKKTGQFYKFSDLITSHTMRRTAITTMLCLEMPENIVRKISGHAPNSKEFYRYVQLSQRFMDKETEKVFEQLQKKELAA